MSVTAPASTSPELTVDESNRQWLQRSLPICRSLLILAGVMFIMYAFIDWLIHPELFTRTLPLRIMASASFFATLLLSYTPTYQKYFVPITLGLSFIAAAVMTWIFFVALSSWWTGVAAMLLMCMGVMCLSGHRTVFVASMLMAWFVPGVTVLFISHSWHEIVFYNFILSTSSATGIYIGEQMRRQFVYTLQLEQRLAREASTDALTGLANRRSFFEIATREWQEVQRHHQSLAVLMIDIDHFKRLNDEYGHARGDAVLKRVATQMLFQLRSNDFAARIGGEEFAILLPHETPESARIVAERLREAIAHYKDDIPCTVSIGVAVSGKSVNDFLHLLKRADTVLYQAKQSGRNCVCVAP